MQIGVLFPQPEFSFDPVLIRDYAQAAESLGFTHISAYEHLVGVNPDRPGGWKGIFTYKEGFIEPFSLFNYMAAITNRIGFVTRILILPQRQTTLVAKQAATLDFLSQGRLRLGVGIGWNEIEYIVQNEDFHNRAERLEEQIALLRKLWTQELVDFSGKWHTVPDAGINPLPVQRPIPIWLGGHSDATLRRVARTGDGWLPNDLTFPQTVQAIQKLERYLEEAGRPRSEIGIEPRLEYPNDGDENLEGFIEGWQKAGATHLCLDSMGNGFETPQEHMDALRRFAEDFDIANL